MRFLLPAGTPDSAGAEQEENLQAPPGNHLEALKGVLLGWHSIRINDQFRVIFRWTGMGPEEVDIVDHH